MPSHVPSRDTAVQTALHAALEAILIALETEYLPGDVRETQALAAQGGATSIANRFDGGTTLIARSGAERRCVLANEFGDRSRPLR